MKVAACSAEPVVWVDSQETDAQKRGIALEDSVNATQISKLPESKEYVHERHHEAMQKDFDEVEELWTETMQLSEKYDNWKADFFNIMQKYESTWDGHQRRVVVPKSEIVFRL